MSYSELIDRAITFASLAHHGQYRESPEKVIPFISYPSAVGFILQRAGYRDEVVAAGILGCVLEKSETTPGQLMEFGDEVYKLTLSVSEPDKVASQKTRQENYYAKFASGDDESRAVALAMNIQRMRHDIASIKAGYNPCRKLKKGPAQKYESWERLILFLERDNIAHRLKDEYRATLDELKDRAERAGYMDAPA
ncbi:MAG: HD domain-containing protein [Nitrospinae bacterium]|nr:HD domain-containing protein [Nitrospinota bacterium]